jgi:hypothetical protein
MSCSYAVVDEGEEGMDGMLDYRVKLIEMARDIALAGTGAKEVSGGREVAFLRKFRAAYHYLAATVEATGASPFPPGMMGESYMRSPEQTRELLQRTEEGLNTFDS